MRLSKNDGFLGTLPKEANVIIIKALTGLRPHGLQGMKVKFFLPTLLKNHNLFLCLIEV